MLISKGWSRNNSLQFYIIIILFTFSFSIVFCHLSTYPVLSHIYVSFFCCCGMSQDHIRRLLFKIFCCNNNAYTDIFFVDRRKYVEKIEHTQFFVTKHKNMSIKYCILWRLVASLVNHHVCSKIKSGL